MNVLSYFAPRVFSHGQIANARLVYSVCVQPTMGLNVGRSVCCDGCLKNIYACVCELAAVPYPAIMSQSHTIMPLIAFLCDTSQHHLFTRSQSLAIIVCLWLKPCLRLRKPFAARVCVAGWRNGGGRPCCGESTGFASASESMDLPPSPPPLSPHPSSVPKCLFMHLGSIQFVRRIPPAPPHQPPRAPLTRTAQPPSPSYDRRHHRRRYGHGGHARAASRTPTTDVFDAAPNRQRLAPMPASWPLAWSFLPCRLRWFRA